MARLRRHEAIEAAAWAVFQTKGWPDMPGCILGRLMDLRAALGPPPDDDEDWPTVEPVKPRLRADEDVRSAIDSIHHD